jgi:molybdate transport system regulatory protein
MNLFSGTITLIESVDSLNLITINSNGIDLLSLTLELDENFKVDAPVEILFNDTEVSISQCEARQVSIANRIPSTVMEIRKDTLLARLILKTPIGELHAVVLSRVLDEMRISAGSSLNALVKATDIGLSVVKN